MLCCLFCLSIDSIVNIYIYIYIRKSSDVNMGLGSRAFNGF